MSTLLEQASLVLIPSGYKEDTVYSVIPSNGSGDLSFTRASDGTRINSDGLVEVTPWNIFGYSEEFNNAYWTKVNTTPTANTTTAPNGTLTADTLVSTGGVNSFLYKILSFTSGAVYTLSFYVKANSAQTIRIYGGGGGIGTSANLNVTTEWTRISYTFTPSASGSFDVGIRTNSSNVDFNIFLWGAQLNDGSTAKPYFPTTDRLNYPRITYQNGRGALLSEPQRTNLTQGSNGLTTNWTNYRGTYTANAINSPDGTVNAPRTVWDGSSPNSVGFFFQNFSFFNASCWHRTALKSSWRHCARP